MTANLLSELEEAKSRVAQIKRRIANATCAEVGHRWKFIGGAHCGCEGVTGCSVPVRECVVCGDSDYGDSDESDFIKERCAMLSPTTPQGVEDER